MGMIKPDEQEPEIDGLQFYYDAFRELASTRQFGFGVGPIPFTAIAEYFTIYGIDGDFFEFSAIIRHMDNVYLSLNAEEMKKTAKQDKGKSNSGNTSNNKKADNQS